MKCTKESIQKKDLKLIKEFIEKGFKGQRKKSKSEIARKIIACEYEPISNFPSVITISSILYRIYYTLHFLPLQFKLQDFIVNIVKEIPEHIKTSKIQEEIQEYLFREFTNNNDLYFYHWTQKLKEKESKTDIKEEIKKIKSQALYTKSTAVVNDPQIIPLIDSILYKLEAFVLEVELMENVIPDIKKIQRKLTLKKIDKPETLFDLWFIDKDDNYRNKTYNTFITALFEENMIDSNNESSMKWKLILKRNSKYKVLACLMHILEKKSIIQLEKKVTAELLLKILEKTFHEKFGHFRSFQRGKRIKAHEDLSDEFKYIINTIDNF